MIMIEGKCLRCDDDYSVHACILLWYDGGGGGGGGNNNNNNNNNIIQQTINTSWWYFSPLWRCSRMLMLMLMLIWVSPVVVLFSSTMHTYCCAVEHVQYHRRTNDNNNVDIGKLRYSKCLLSALCWYDHDCDSNNNNSERMVEAFVLHDSVYGVVTRITHHQWCTFLLTCSFCSFVRSLLFVTWFLFDETAYLDGYTILYTLSSLFPVCCQYCTSTILQYRMSPVVSYTVPNSLSTVPIYLSTCHNDVLLDIWHWHDLTYTMGEVDDYGYDVMIIMIG